MAYDPAENSLVHGSLVGRLTAVDPDSAILTFTATKPAHGQVTVDPDGTFTYTPDATFAGHDSFDVTVSDASSGFQIHGLSGLINLVTFGLLGDRGDSYTRTITIDGFTRNRPCRVGSRQTDGFSDPAGRSNPHRRKGRSDQSNWQGWPPAERTVDHAADQHVLGTRGERYRGGSALRGQRIRLCVIYRRTTTIQRLSRITVTDLIG